MSVKILQERLASYRCSSQQEESYAVKEIMQEVALSALARTDFFKYAAFQGGTALRILYQLERFSEDLDFILLKTTPAFDWSKYLTSLEAEFLVYGVDARIVDRSKADENVKKAFLKDDSFGKILLLSHQPMDRRMATVKIKLELDTHPPEGGSFETKYLDFPFSFAVTAQDGPTLFAGKSHALLCRKYTKGRDWYDFLWYVGRNTQLNYQFLAAACHQQGPWQNQALHVDRDWYLTELKKKILTVHWKEAREDVARFLRPRELESLKLWSHSFFMDRWEKLSRNLR